MSVVIVEDPAWKAILADERLLGVRRKLSFHEIRLIMQHVRDNTRPTPDLGEDEELVERLTYLIQFHVYAEAEARDVQCVIDSLSERDGWTASGGWIIVKEDDWIQQPRPPRSASR